MATLGSRVSDKVVELLTAPDGLNAKVAALAAEEDLALGEFSERQVVPQNVASEIAEKAREVRYPMLHVYCEKIRNQQREKFRSFSGFVEITVEVRVSQDRLEGLERKLQLYGDAVMQVLDANRGDWGAGMVYFGGYEAAFGMVKHGGRNFWQAVKVTFEVGVSRN